MCQPQLKFNMRNLVNNPSQTEHMQHGQTTEPQFGEKCTTYNFHLTKLYNISLSVHIFIFVGELIVNLKILKICFLNSMFRG